MRAASSVMPEAAPTYKGTDANQLFYLKKVAMLYGNGQIIDDLVKTPPDLLPNVGAVLMPVNKPDQVTRSFLVRATRRSSFSVKSSS